MSERPPRNPLGRELKVMIETNQGEVLTSCWLPDAVNANAAMPLRVRATVFCDLGHEHDVGNMDLYCFSPKPASQ